MVAVGTGFSVLAVGAVVDRHGVERFGSQFRILERRLRHNKVFLDEVGHFMLNSVRQNFTSGGRPTRWKNLARSTVDSRLRGVETAAIHRVLKRAKAAEQRLAQGLSVNAQGRAALDRRIDSRSGGDILSKRGKAAVKRRQREISPSGRKSGQPSHLRWTGRLLASLRARTISRGDGSGRVQVYSISKYARIHQFGGVIHIPGDQGREGEDPMDLKKREARAASRKAIPYKKDGKVLFTRTIAKHDVHIPPRPFLLFQPTDSKSIQEIGRRYLQRAVTGTS